MRQAVEDILNGKFNAGGGFLEFSCPRVELTLNVGAAAEGSFMLFGREGCEVEGYVVSTDLRMECLTKSFDGNQGEIRYRFDAGSLEAGEEVKGAFNIISNQGEYYIPFAVTIREELVTSDMGGIRNLFHFTNLAKSNWDEAVRLFYSESFRTLFAGNDRQHYAVYKGLSAVRGNEHNVEEFLLAINKKKPVEYLPEETEIRIEDPAETTRYALVINRNGWGYTRLRIETEGDFLRVEENLATDASFLGNIYRLYYYVDCEKLHAGNNYGCIMLIGQGGRMRIPVTVAVHRAAKRRLALRRETGQLTVRMMELYQSFRLKKISTKTWMTETNQILDRLTEIDDRNIAWQLFRAQILLTEERYNEAKWLIERQQEQVLMRQQEEQELWCYYLYLTTLYSKDYRYVEDAAAEVREVYERNRGNWRIAWLLMYLSEEYTGNPARRWELLEELFRCGCTSPVIYLEAWHLLAANPAMLLALDAFEQQILLYALKNDLMKEEIVLQIVYLAQKQKNYSQGIFHILTGCYEKRPQNDILHAICTLLIRGGRYGEAYFEWYRAGVEQNLRVTRLYEHYMMSLPRRGDITLPKTILMYFAYQSDLNYEVTAYLYAYVYRHREEVPDIYVNYMSDIERFTAEQLSRGRINKDLAYLYRSLITRSMIDETIAEKLVTLIFMRELHVESGQIKEAIPVYPYVEGERVYPVAAGRAQFPVFSSECSILLGDGTGNRYAVSVESRTEMLLGPEKLAPMLSIFARGNLGYAVYTCFAYRDAFAVQEDNVDLFLFLSTCDRIEESVRREIRMMLVRFYYDRDRMRELDDYLLELKPEETAAGDRGEIVRYMIVRGMYREAYEWVRRYGPYGVDAKMLARMCSRLLDEEREEEDPVLTAILHYTVGKGKYDENILRYLIRFFHGSMREMRDIWKIADNFGMDTHLLSERMIGQMLYTGAHVGEKMEIFRSYCEYGGSEALRAAFVTRCCYDYVIGGQIIEPYIFRCVMQLSGDLARLQPVCRIAFLQYYAENREEQDDTIKRVCCEFLRDLTADGIVLPVYREYLSYLPQMDEYRDKTIIEHRVKPGGSAVIHYVIQRNEGEQNEYCREVMRDMYEGICVKEFILFFGERLQYYITEESENGEQLAGSGAINKSDIEQDNFESRFTMLNDIMIGMTLHDYDTVDNLLLEYYRTEHMVKTIFRMR